MLKGYKTIIRHLRDIKTDYSVTGNGKLREAMNDLHRKGYETASSCFDYSSSFPGTHEVYVNELPGWSGNTLTLSATGRDVAFQEFGAGVIFPATNPNASEHGFTPASWSVEHAGNLLGEKLDKQGGYWFYGGEKVAGNPSANAMYQAAQNMKNGFSDVVDGTFKGSRR